MYNKMYNEKLEKFNKKLFSYFNNLKATHKNSDLLQAMAYTTFLGGKRLRPIILLEFYDMLKRAVNKLKDDAVYDFAIAIELIHTFSLIHDDLPCMDNDSIRRGQKANHIVYGENVAMLAGDALIMQAFDILLNDNILKIYKVSQVIKVIKILLKSSGLSGMTLGQCLEISLKRKANKDNEKFEDKTYDKKLESYIQNVYKLKTGALFSASSQIAAVLSDADNIEIELAKNYGENFGIAFQLADDIKDYKISNKNIDYVSIYGLEKAGLLLKNKINYCMELLSKMSGNTETLKIITQSINL